MDNIRRELDGIVITAELTMISITQGVALYFLIESSYEIIVSMHFFLWPYVVVGLLVIFVFWSRTMIHTLTIIRWPLEFIHNFMYIACTLVEAVMFTQITKPANWFILGFANAVMIWVTFLFDLRMIRRIKTETGESTKKEFIELLERDQVLNAKIILPVMMGFSILIIIVSSQFTDFFIQSNGHLYFAIMQMLFLSGYTIYTLRFYKTMTPLILAHRQAAWH